MAKKERSERVRKYGEVFTPEWLVKDMCNMLQDNAGEEVYSPEKTFLEPSCGTGNFLVEILARKLANSKSDEDIITSLNSIYGVELLPDNVEICRKRLLDMIPESLKEQAENILKEHIWCGNFLEPETIPFLADESERIRETIEKSCPKRRKKVK